MKDLHRYRLVNLAQGKVVIVLYSTAIGDGVLADCKMACDFFGVYLEEGEYRLEKLIQDSRSSKLQWIRGGCFTLQRNNHYMGGD